MYNWNLVPRPLQTYLDLVYGRWLMDLLKEARTLLDLPPAVGGRLDAALNPMPSSMGLDTLILALTPRVRLVDVTVPSTVPNNGSSPLPWILGGQEDEPVRHGLSRCCLPLLTEVRLTRDRYRPENFDLVELEPLLLHPTLKILRVCKFECRARHVSELKWPDRVSKLETLELRECFLDSTGMRSILARCSNIRRLAIHLGGEPSQLELWQDHLISRRSRQPTEYRILETLDLTLFSQMLRELAKDLIELGLNTARYRDTNEIPGEIEFLHELGSLRCLKLTPRDLGNPVSLSGKLPPSLESLVLYYHALPGYDRQPTEDLAKVIAADGHPNLRVAVSEGEAPIRHLRHD